MGKTKVQFIGIKDLPNNNDYEIFRVRKVKWDANGYQSEEDLSFHDYHIVFINYSQRYPYPIAMEFFDYISTGGIVVFFLGPSNSYPWGNNDDFLLVSISKGESVIPNPKHWLKNIFKKYKFNWYCLLQEGSSLLKQKMLKDLSQIGKQQRGEPLEDNTIFEIAGATISKKCVSSVVRIGSGKLILLPIPERMSVDLIRDLLDGIKNNYFKKDVIPEIRPQWIEKWNLQPELELKGERDAIISQYIKIKDKIEWYESIKKILYSQGKELSFYVNLILKEMGFEAIFKEEEGNQDIEIKLNNFFAIIEVKGLNGFANNDNLRQLFEYYATTSEKNPEVKGIFIVNHFRNKDPSERGESYTLAAINLATKNEFCLLTTVDLFKMYNQFLDGKITTDQIKNIFQATKGLLRY